MNKNWTKEQELLLIENKDEDWEYLSKILNKGTKAIKSKFHKMGLTRKQKLWTDEEINFLKENYLKSDWDLLCNILGRKRGTIEAKARSLGIKKNKTWNKKMIEDLKIYYPNFSHEFLEEYFETNWDNIKAKATSLKIKRNTNSRKWTEEENDFIKKNCFDMTCAEMGEILDRTETCIQNHLVYLGLTKTDKRKYLGKIKYQFNRNYFQNIDTQEKAYWLGFLWGDGWITKNKVACCLNETDIGHLRKLNKCLGGNVPIKKRFQEEHYSKSLQRTLPNFYGAEINLFSKKMSEDLQRLGMIYRNTYNHCGIPKIPKEFVVHFIRGLFDADGSVSLSGWNTMICCGCNYELYQEIREFLYSNYGIRSNMVKNFGVNAYCYKLNCSSKKDSVNFGKLIYSNSTIFLNRKKDKYEDFINVFASK